MLLTIRNRARIGHGTGCVCCDEKMTPGNLKKWRRTVKRIDRNRWKNQIRKEMI